MPPDTTTKRVAFEQVQSARYYMQIVDQIRSSVLEGRFKVGDRLPPERQLAKEFGTSRATIREALSALETLGIISCKIGQGNFIKIDGSEISIDGEFLKERLKNHNPYEIFESRLEIEPSLAVLAARRASDKEKKRLERQIEKLDSLGVQIEERLSSAGECDHLIDEYMEEDRKFHLLIGQCAHNSVLFMVFSGVNLMMKEESWTLLKRRCFTGAGNIRKYTREHRAIYEAIRDGKTDTVRATMRRHIKDIEKDLFTG